MMVEGVSIRAISRMTGASKNTIVKLLADAGQACSEYQDRTLVNLPCKLFRPTRFGVSFMPKQKNVAAGKRGQFGHGDVWTWTAIVRDTKLVPLMVCREARWRCGLSFMSDLASRLANRVQLTTDGHHAYLTAVDDAFAVTSIMRSL